MTEYLVTRLNQYGMVSDEDNDIVISSSMLENWSKEHTEILHKKGYIGGDLLCIGRYFRGHDALYVLYDTDNVSNEEAMSFLEALGSRDSASIE